MDGETQLHDELLDVSTLVPFPLNPRKIREDDPGVRELAERGVRIVAGKRLEDELAALREMRRTG